MGRAQSNWKLGAVVAVGLIALIVILGGIWGEAHYRNCLSSVELRYPVAYQQGEAESSNQYSDALEGKLKPHFVIPHEAERNEAISSCSRWP